VQEADDTEVKMSTNYIKLKIRRGDEIPTDPALEEGELFYRTIRDENNAVTNSELYIGKGGGNYAKVGADFSYTGDGVSVSGNTITIPGYQFSGDAVTTSGTSVTINHQTVSELFDVNLPVTAGTYYLSYDEEDEEWAFSTVQSVDTNHFVTGGSYNADGSGALTLNIGSETLNTGAQSDVVISGITAYDNGTSNLNASTFQAAIDEIDGTLDNVVDGTQNITYDNTTSELAATNIKAAIDEVDGILDNVIDGTQNITYNPSVSGLTGVTNIKQAIDTIDGNLDAVIAGTTNITFSDSNIDATNVSGALSELASEAAAVETRVDALEDEARWEKVAEVNSTSSSVTLNSSNLGESFNNADYDYKFVVLAQTNATDTSGQFFIRLDNDSTSGRHSSVRHMTTMGSSGPVETVSGADGSAGSEVDTGLTLGTGTGTQGSQTLLDADFIISRGLGFSTDNSLLDNYPYILRGSGSVVSVEAANQTATATVSYTRLSQFTGGFLKSVQHDESGNLGSVVISNLPDAGSNDNSKIRIYKRGR